MTRRGRSATILAAFCAAIASCGGNDAERAAIDASSMDDAGWPLPDASADAGGSDAALAPSPRAPCNVGSCWLNAPTLHACSGSTAIEDFATGLYNVHRYPLSAPAGAGVDLVLDVAGGSWNPALMVLTTDGTTLYDGEHPLLGGPVTIDPLEPGKGTTSAKVRVTAAANTELHVFVTSWEVVDGGFAPPMPSDASYTLSATADCPAPNATCPLNPSDITKFGSGYYTAPGSPYQAPGDTRPEHLGYDIYAQLGTPVLATESGTIISVVTTPASDDLCGKSINLAADSGVTFRYCHLDSVLVQSGTVEPGHTIGTVGKTGNANSEHLHFGYLDAPNVVGVGTIAQKSEKVNGYIDALCK